MERIGLSTSGFELTQENFVKLAAANIRDIEISCHYQKFPDIDFRKTKKIADETGVRLWSVHLPFASVYDYDLGSTDAKVHRATLDYYSELIAQCSDVGVDKFVVHPSSEPKDEGELRDEQMKKAMEGLHFLAEFADRHGAVIAVEDLPRSCLGRNSQEVEQLISVHDKLRVCLDTNHLLGEEVLDFIEKLGSKIVTLHVSDYDKVNERHWLPGEGVLDWQKIYGALKKVGYQGVWLYEIGLACPKTILRDRDLTFEDFYRNACEIFENRPLTVFSKHKQNLGMWE